ncbi:hypothetical protein [Limnofasciculus baicalensis]|uniref:Uncharacterized protein n=1 Tax=Limnofasciculus baicalensis BBK-W-15 TaxID=2699891 RepID=A0AAE3GR11_9CYAN|nr:hypothetical protein [Limnofasciculus baicalensis]MCP2729130.1 hypothetical protein [Limnofasciculus baicalensis BBK-W-15]
MNLEAEFLTDITRRCFPSELTDKYLRERIFFPLRFTRRESQPGHPEIAKKMSEMAELKGVDCKNSINTTVKTAIRKLVDTFGEEMAGDGVNTAPLIQGERGKHGAWQEAYRWLWDYQFPRWKLDWFWRELVKQAMSPAGWIRFTPAGKCKGLVVPPGKQREQPAIGLNIPSAMFIDLAENRGNLLLLNRGLGTRYVICPSTAFAPKNRLMGETILIPDSGAMCEEMIFDSLGQEEFLGIVVDWDWDFDWLQLNEEQPVPIWDGERLEDLWVKLEKQGSWCGFYQCCEVVEVPKI